MQVLSRLKRANRFRPSTLIATLVAAACLVAPGSAAAEPTIQTTTTISCGGKVRFADSEVLCTARVRSSVGATAPTGTVKLTAEGGPIPASCTLIKLIGPESVCQGTFRPHIAGQLTVRANYIGSQTHLPSSGNTAVPVSDTATSLTCSPESPVVGEASTCTANVKSFGPVSDASGTVSFKSSGEGGQLEPSSCTLGEGAACSVNFSPKVGDEYQVTATYEGDTTHPSSRDETTVTARGATVTTVKCSGRIVFPDTPTGCLAIVKNLDPGATLPRGLVVIRAGAEIARCSLVDLSPLRPESAAECNFAPREGGQLPIVANYIGDRTHLPSSGNTTLAVTNSATSLNCQPESPAVGEASICTAEVRNTGAASDDLSGTLSFKSNQEGRFEPSSCNVDESNVCTVKYFPAVGTNHLVTATYGGDAAHPGSRGEATLAVRGTSISLLSCGQETEVYEPVSCVARVVNNGLGSRSLTGKVQFTSSTDGRFSSRECTLLPFLNNDGGFCSVSYTPEAAGANVISAVYSGDDTHPPARDGKGQVNALPRPTTTTVTCSGSPKAGNTECEVRVRDNNPFRATPPSEGIKWFSTEERRPFDEDECRLEPVNSVESKCKFPFKPRILATQLMVAQFLGFDQPPDAFPFDDDKVHAPSRATIRLIYPTTTEVDCGDSAVVDELKVCTATVRTLDLEPRPTEGSPTAPTGPVRFSSTAMGTFSQTSCTLEPIGPDTSSCSRTYKPQADGSHVISAFYDGDLKRDPSFNTKGLVVRSR